MKETKEILTDKDLKSMPRKQLIRLLREEQKKSEEFQKKYEKILYWLKQSAEFATAPSFDKDGSF